MLYGPDRELFLLLPEKYPRGYYPPTALRFIVFPGLTVALSRKFNLEFNYRYLDSEILAYKDSPGDWISGQIGSLGINMNYSWE